MTIQSKSLLLNVALASLFTLSIAGCDKSGAVSTIKQSSSSVMSSASSSSIIDTSAADAEILRKINLALSEDETLSDFDIVVMVNKGDVNLTGDVDNQSLRDQAVALAKATEGVGRVEDMLSIGE